MWGGSPGWQSHAQVVSGVDEGLGLEGLRRRLDLPDHIINPRASTFLEVGLEGPVTGALGKMKQKNCTRLQELPGRTSLE